MLILPLIDFGKPAFRCRSGTRYLTKPRSVTYRPDPAMSDPVETTTKKRELTIFLFLAFVLAPILSVIIVAGYGFCVWMVQIIMGPPSV